MNSELSTGLCYPPFEQLGPEEVQFQPFKVLMTWTFSNWFWSELWKCLPKIYWILANRKMLYPLQKCPRDWGRVEDQRKADDVMWCQLIGSSFAFDSSRCFRFCGIKRCIWLWRRYSEVYEDSEDDCRSCRRLSLYAIMPPSISLKTAGGRNIMKHFTDEL